MIRITADVFSGRPNPTYQPEAGEAVELLRLISQTPSSMTSLREGFDGLGYRGLIVEVLGDTVAANNAVPSTFRIPARAEPKGQEITDRILSSMRKAQAV